MDTMNMKFRARVVSTFQTFKSELCEYPNEPIIPICQNGNEVARLRPVKARATDHEIKLLTQWRNENKESFLTWIISTEESTRRWLSEQIIPREDRILFIAETLEAVPFGQIGLTNFDFSLKACELDNWIRGKAGVLKGGMTLAIRALMDWVFFELEAQSTYARVFSDNEHVINLHQRNGLRILKRVPLKCINEATFCRWVEVEDDLGGPFEKYLVYLKIDRNEYVR